jgi:hypothetical protein
VKGDWGLGDDGAGQLAPTEVAQNGVMLLIGLGARQTSYLSPFTFHGIACGSIVSGLQRISPRALGSDLCRLSTVQLSCGSMSRNERYFYGCELVSGSPKQS